MPRYQFDKPSRAALLDELIAAGFSPLTEVGSDDTRTWVTVDEADHDRMAAVVAAHNAAALDAADAASKQAKQAARALVVQAAQSAVGVRFDQLSAQQVRALAAILFWKEGALDGGGIVQPLAKWVASATTIIGGYTLDLQGSYWWTNGFDSQILMDSSAARQTIIENTWLTSGANPPRLVFSVIPDASAYAVPIYIGQGKLHGEYGHSPVDVYPIGTRHRFWSKPVPSAVKIIQ